MTNLSTSPVLPEYTVRVSARAKHVRLKITPADGLVVVVPGCFNHALLDDIVARHVAWIEKTFRRYGNAIEQTKKQLKVSLPDVVELPALGEAWSVSYIDTSSSTVRASQPGHRQLQLSGNVADADACGRALRRWLMRHARENLITRLERVGRDCGLTFSKATVRGQRTRWGSCSSTGTISLNFQLMFVSPEMLRYVLLHELCHTVHLDHSPAFHALVERYEPEYKTLELQLRQAWQMMPGWLHRLQVS